MCFCGVLLFDPHRTTRQSNIFRCCLIKKNDRLTPTYLIVFASEPGQLEGLVWWVCFCATWGPTRLGSGPTRDEELVKPTNCRSRRLITRPPISYIGFTRGLHQSEIDMWQSFTRGVGFQYMFSK
jgi:hypothetical protein